MPDLDAARVDRVLAGLDTRERVGQLNQRLLGWQAVERVGGTLRVTDLLRAEIDRWSGLGALYGLFRADAWSGRSWSNGIRPQERADAVALVHEAVAAASPAGIRPLIVEEAPHGHQALGGELLPSNLTVAAAWDPDLLAEASEAVAAGLAASGVHIALVSALDLLRDPRWGRCEECFGEAPALAAELTRAVVEGMQGPGRSRIGSGGVAVVLKHLAAQGEAVGGRNGQSAVIGPRDLRELHLPAVRAGVRAGALGFMAAYTDIDGVPCCANHDLLTGYLREECGFDGIVLADGLAVDRLATMTGDVASAGRAALLAGVDVSLWDTGFTTLTAAAREDAGVAAAVEAACRRVLTLKQRFGLLGEEPGASGLAVGSGASGGEVDGTDRASEQAGTDRARERDGWDRAREPDGWDRARERDGRDRARERLTVSAARARDASRRLADRALVLLHNSAHTLPLASPALRRVVVTGPFADDVTALLGDYVPPLPAPGPPGIGGSLRVALPDAEVLVRADGPPSAADLAGADAVVVVVGGTSHRSYDDTFADNGAVAGGASRATCGEGVDLADISLPDGQDAWVAAVRGAAACPVVAVVVAGRPHVLTDLVAHADAVLWAGYPGPSGGAAVADALLGRTEPTGRLPMTLPRHPSTVPVRHDDRHPATGRYQDVPDPVLFPLGHGLRYRDVTVHDLRADVAPDRVTVDVRVTNPGADPTRVVLPLFAHRAGGSTLPRLRELLAFRSVEVPAGATAAVRWEIDPAACFAAPADPAATTRLDVDDLSADIRS